MSVKYYQYLCLPVCQGLYIMWAQSTMYVRRTENYFSPALSLCLSLTISISAFFVFLRSVLRSLYTVFYALIRFHTSSFTRYQSARVEVLNSQHETFALETESKVSSFFRGGGSA